jgi:hypothetical protein
LNAPTVMSNAPCDSLAIQSDFSSTANVSLATEIHSPLPAAALMRDTSEVGTQVLSSASRRSISVMAFFTARSNSS